VHIPYTFGRAGVGGGDTWYIRSTDNGQTWSSPVEIGENGPNTDSDRQARVQVVADNDQVFVVWQREGEFTGAPLPPDRLGYNHSNDGGVTWLGDKILPFDSGVRRNHQHVWMVPGGAVHLTWLHGSPAESSSPNGYMFSPDNGATWSNSEITLSTSVADLPFSIVADANWVHIITAPGGSRYARPPGFREVVARENSVKTGKDSTAREILAGAIPSRRSTAKVLGAHRRACYNAHVEPCRAEDSNAGEPTHASG